MNETAGDGLMVIFQRSNRAEPGRPDEDHALNATRAAFAIQARTLELNEEYAGVFPAIQLHMGINTGEALLGATKLGGAGSQRWTFTATGPTTNLAARFAGSAQGGDIVVGPVTAERIKTRFVLEAWANGRSRTSRSRSPSTASSRRASTAASGPERRLH